MNEKRVKEWITLANGDLKTAKDELLTSEPYTNNVCFLCQQSVEKYLKAFLTFYGKAFRKTHDIAELINNCLELNNEFEILFYLNVDKLTLYAVDIRYPDDFYTPTYEEAKEAIEIAEAVKNFIIDKLKEAGFYSF
jgi:HEPN domain-containing protein